MSEYWLNKYLKNNSKIKSIDLTELKENLIDCTKLKEFKSVGSYSWLKNKTNMPTILVAGKPNRLRNDDLRGFNNIQLCKSNRTNIVDENKFYYPEFPLEPLFRAVKICSPEYDFKKTDIVTDRNNLRKLLNFIENKAKDPFRIDFQKCGNSVVFIRNDEQLEQNSQDYGKDFEERLTEFQLDNAGGFRRVVSYKFGELNILTRFEVDCCERTLSQSGRKIDNDSVDQIASSLAGVRLNSPQYRFSDSRLAYYKEGVFQEEKVIELTTKSTYRGQYEFPESKWNQMFFSNTDFLIIGWHSRGRIQKLEKLTFKEVTTRCNRINVQTSLSKLHNLLLIIISIVSENTNKSIYSVIYDPLKDANKIEIHECSNHPGCLPKTLYDELS